MKDSALEKCKADREERIALAKQTVEADRAANGGNLSISLPLSGLEDARAAVRSLNNFPAEVQNAVMAVTDSSAILRGDLTHANMEELRGALERLEIISPGWTFDALFQHPVPPPVPGVSIPKLGADHRGSRDTGVISMLPTLSEDKCLQACVAKGLVLPDDIAMVPVPNDFYRNKGGTPPGKLEAEYTLSSGNIL